MNAWGNRPPAKAVLGAREPHFEFASVCVTRPTLARGVTVADVRLTPCPVREGDVDGDDAVRKAEAGGWDMNDDGIVPEPQYRDR